MAPCSRHRSRARARSTDPRGGVIPACGVQRSRGEYCSGGLAQRPCAQLYSGASPLPGLRYARSEALRCGLAPEGGRALVARTGRRPVRRFQPEKRSLARQLYGCGLCDEAKWAFTWRVGIVLTRPSANGTYLSSRIRVHSQFANPHRAQGCGWGRRRASEAPRSAGLAARARSALREHAHRSCLSGVRKAHAASSAMGPQARAPQGSRSAAKAASVKRPGLPARVFAARQTSRECLLPLSKCQSR